MRNILKKILVVFVVPKVIAWARRRYGGARGTHPR